MERPTAPSWFTGKLRLINAALGVRHTGGPQGWQITQDIRKLSYEGEWDGNKLYVVKNVPEHVGYYKDLGSAILYELPRGYTARYNTYEDFCRANKIRYE